MQIFSPARLTQCFPFTQWKALQADNWADSILPGDTLGETASCVPSPRFGRLDVGGTSPSVLYMSEVFELFYKVGMIFS